MESQVRPHSIRSNSIVCRREQFHSMCRIGDAKRPDEPVVIIDCWTRNSLATRAADGLEHVGEEKRPTAKVDTNPLTTSTQCREGGGTDRVGEKDSRIHVLATAAAGDGDRGEDARGCVV